MALSYSAVDEIRELELLRAEYGGQSFRDCLAEQWPHEPPPRHLAPVLDVWERTRYEPIRAIVEVPPRHAKTVTTQRGFVWRLRRDPALTNVYATYGADLAESKSRQIRDWSVMAGVELAKDARKLSEWRTRWGGGLLATSVGGALTGQGADGVIVVDDPFKDRKEAESRVIRNTVWEWFWDVVMSRRMGQCSVIVQHTRWHVDDLIGRLLKQGWHQWRPR